MKPRRQAVRSANSNPSAIPTSPTNAPLPTTSPTWTVGWRGWGVLCAGWLLPQLVLLGPALVGRTVDLPVDLLALPYVYLPERPEFAAIKPHHGVEVIDLVVGTQTVRDFAVKELRAGRLPLWQPANFAGAPFADWPKYSPFEIPYLIAPVPITLAWMAVLQAVTIGLGMWLLARRCFGLSYWPAALAAWCAPLTGFMTIWHGFVPAGIFCWLPWSLWAVHGAVRKPRSASSPAVAVVTALVLLSGNPGVAGLVLLTTGLYAVWLLATDVRVERRGRGVAWAAATVGLAWIVGFLIAAPYYLPLFEYGQTGARLDLRAGGAEERPPQGLAALTPIVLPDVYGGKTRANWTSSGALSVSFPESSSAAYAGLLATLWLAPLAWCDRRRRSQVIFLTLLVIVSLGWTLKLPGLVDLLRSPPLRPLASLAYNRWVMATSLAILLLAAIGLEQFNGASARFRWWFAIPLLLTAAFGAWCVYRRLNLAASIDRGIYARCFELGVVLCVATVVGWTLTIREVTHAKWIRLGLVCLLPLELFWFAWNERRQADSALYYPPVPVLEKLARLPSGRIWGVRCLPPDLNQAVHLEDARGYDGVDPRNFIKLFELAFDVKNTLFFRYARTQMAIPTALASPHGLFLHPVAALLNVRYLIFRDPPAARLPVILHEDNYWIVENREVLPRAFVPRTLRFVKNDKEAIASMARFDFKPREVAYTADHLRLPDAMQGTAAVRYETPTHAQLDVDMQTDGLVLVSDLWDAGWNAELDGAPCPIYRVDVALRGFQVPAGKHQIVCRYEPQSVRTGFRAAALGGLILFVWAIWLVVEWRRSRQTTGAVLT